MIAVAGVRLVRRAATVHQRGFAAAALAAVATFLVAAAYDWVWDLPVIAIAFLLLGGDPAVATANRIPSGGRPARMGMPSPSGERRGPRVALGVAAVVALLAIALPLAATNLVRASQADAREAMLGGALADARDAHSVQPFAATPLLQEALVLEVAGDVDGAARGRARRDRRGADELARGGWSSLAWRRRPATPRPRSTPTARRDRSTPVPRFSIDRPKEVSR